jgi:hypothetical protein
MKQEYVYHVLLTVHEYLLFLMKQEYACHMLMTVQEYLLCSDEAGICLSCSDYVAGIICSVLMKQ